MGVKPDCRLLDAAGPLGWTEVLARVWPGRAGQAGLRRRGVAPEDRRCGILPHRWSRSGAEAHRGAAKRHASSRSRHW